MNLLLGGHYATEVFGVKALAAHLSNDSEFHGNSSIARLDCDGLANARPNAVTAWNIWMMTVC